MLFRDNLSKIILLSFCFVFSASAAEEEKLPHSQNVSQEVDSKRTAEYLEKRRKWLLKDANINFSHNIVLNADEQKLDQQINDIVLALQTQFLNSNLFCPSRNFLNIKNCIESFPLFAILRRMPKGGLLHIHSSSTGNAEWLIQRAVSDENCYMYLQDDGSILKGTMRVFPNGKAPAGFQLMRELAAKDKDFVPKAVEMITMTSEDSLSPNPMDKFNACFKRVVGLLFYKPIFRDYYQQSFEALAKDHIQIIELRAGYSGFTQMHDLDGKEYTPHDVISLYRELVQEIRQKHPDFTLKLIISNLRTLDVVSQRSLLEAAYELRSENPDLVVGYDLVGDESEGHTTLYYLDNLLNGASEFSKKYHTTLPYFFHDGESDWANDTNLYDAILLKTKRIGHGFNLFHFPLLMLQVKQREICLEICPISNQVLGYVGDLRLHPSAGYLKQGLPCVLGSDDPMLFKTEGLSYDFWEAIMAWNLSLADIKQLCINSIRYSALDEPEKKKAFASWNKAWDLFVQETLVELQKKGVAQQEQL